jgi:hypothetical protein
VQTKTATKKKAKVDKEDLVDTDKQRIFLLQGGKHNAAAIAQMKKIVERMEYILQGTVEFTQTN